MRRSSSKQGVIGHVLGRGHPGMTRCSLSIKHAPPCSAMRPPSALVLGRRSRRCGARMPPGSSRWCSGSRVGGSWSGGPNSCAGRARRAWHRPIPRGNRARLRPAAQACTQAAPQADAHADRQPGGGARARECAAAPVAERPQGGVTHRDQETGVGG